MLSDEDAIDCFAKLTIHAFLIEIVIANWMRSTPDPEKTLLQLRQEFLEAVRYKSSVPDRPDLDTNTASAIHEAAVAYAEHFLDGVGNRLGSLLER